MHVDIAVTLQGSVVDAANHNPFPRRRDGRVRSADTQVTPLVSVEAAVSRKLRQVGRVPADVQVIRQDFVANAVDRKHNHIKQQEGELK